MQMPCVHAGSKMSDRHRHLVSKHGTLLHAASMVHSSQHRTMLLFLRCAKATP